MKKCWLFEETEEVRKPKLGEWLESNYGPHKNTGFPWNAEVPILKLTEFSSNPLEPIKEVAELAETALTAIELLSLETRKWDEYKDLYKLAKAISEAMKRMEGK